MKNYLATTGIPELWNLDSNLLLLGPWCLRGEKNKELLKDKDCVFVPSPWKPVPKIREAADYCHRVYEELIPQLSKSLNSIHQVSYPVKYWRILLGPWLLSFIEVLYDRYHRIKKAVEVFPDFYTYVLPLGQRKLMFCDTYDFNKMTTKDYCNLKLFSLILCELYPEKIIEKDFESEPKDEFRVVVRRWGLKRKMFYNFLGLFDIFLKDAIVLSDMYHLKPRDMLLLKWKLGLRTISFINFESISKKGLIKDNCSYNLRGSLALQDGSDKFLSLLYKILPDAIPMCYVEDYRLYRKSANSIKRITSINTVGSVIGWYTKEKFKFFAAEAALKGAKLIDFQHGGGYGLSLVLPPEILSLEKDIFYSWGWGCYSKKENKVEPLPSPHLSRLMNSHLPRIDRLLFVGTAVPKYQYRFHSILFPDDMPKYFKDKKTFIQALPVGIRNKVLYRLYPHDYGWDELNIVQKIWPNVKFILKGNLVEWMQKAKLVVIDHPHTSFIEALTINVPSVFYWDHQVYLMRAESEKYFGLLIKAGIVHNGPEGAAKKVKEIFDNPMKWWLDSDVQKARCEFCSRYAYAREDWLKIWVEELNNLNTAFKYQ